MSRVPLCKIEPRDDYSSSNFMITSAVPRMTEGQEFDEVCFASSLRVAKGRLKATQDSRLIFGHPFDVALLCRCSEKGKRFPSEFTWLSFGGMLNEASHEAAPLGCIIRMLSRRLHMSVLKRCCCRSSDLLPTCKKYYAEKISPLENRHDAHGEANWTSGL